MKVLIFYNGQDFSAPDSQSDCWSNYKNENSPRMFLAAAASWQRLGWQVERVSTVGLQGGFNFTGVLKRDLDRYPIEFWNVWHVWLKHAPCFVANMDVFNQSFDYCSPQYAPNNPGLKRSMSLHVNGWTASVGYVTEEYCWRVIEMIDKADRKLDHINASRCPMFCDDWLVRMFYPPEVAWPICDFAHIKKRTEPAQLLQFPRSTILRSIETIPVVS